MKAIILAAAVSALLAGAATADPHPYGYNNNNDNHQSSDRHAGWGHDYGNDNSHHWQRGQRMGYNDWSSAQPACRSEL